jgi:hypothetical protein
VEELWCGRQVPVGRFRIDVAEICRQPRELDFGVLALLIRIEECADCEAVSLMPTSA